MPQELTVQLHSRECSCRGALWMLPQGAAVHCTDATGAPPSDAVVLSAANWRALGKPRTIEGHQVAVRRASPQLRNSLTAERAPA
jgi:hypothetical protein